MLVTGTMVGLLIVTVGVIIGLLVVLFGLMLRENKELKDRLYNEEQYKRFRAEQAIKGRG